MTGAWVEVSEWKKRALDAEARISELEAENARLREERDDTDRENGRLALGIGRDVQRIEALEAEVARLRETLRGLLHHEAAPS